MNLKLWTSVCLILSAGNVFCVIASDTPVVRLHVFTSHGVNKSFEITYNSLHTGQFEKICPGKAKPFLKFIMHGFAERWNMEYRWDWVKDMTAEMLKTREADQLCIVAIDWKVRTTRDSLNLK